MHLFEQLHPEWQKILSDQKQLLLKIESTISRSDVTPKIENIMAAYKVAPKDVKVVIIGQDPYPTPGYAQGLAFSVSEDVQPLPASLRNIFKEVHDDCGVPSATNGDLQRWSQQGVFLLNRVLTTAPGASMVHAEIGWQLFTSATAQVLGELDVVGVFWGNKAYELAHFFNPHHVISSPHPSPLSAYRGFFGSRPFSKVNQILLNQGKTAIHW